jgi:hypothetical protein
MIGRSSRSGPAALHVNDSGLFRLSCQVVTAPIYRERANWPRCSALLNIHPLEIVSVKDRYQAPGFEIAETLIAGKPAEEPGP